MAWLDFWGGYLHDGPYNNVVLLGSPNGTGPFSSNLNQAHNAGYGYGINFSQNDNGSVHTKINLVGFALDSNGSVLYGQHYVRFGGTYNYILNIQTSNDNQKSWKTIFNRQIFSHGDSWNLCYGSYWTDVAQHSQYQCDINIEENATHVKVCLTGERPTDKMSVIYTIEQVIQDYRPWAVRKGGKFLTCNRNTGFTRIRKNGSWQDIKKMTECGQTNKGTSRIRHSNNWVGQKKVGEL